MEKSAERARTRKSVKEKGQGSTKGSRFQREFLSRASLSVRPSPNKRGRENGFGWPKLVAFASDTIANFSSFVSPVVSTCKFRGIAPLILVIQFFALPCRSILAVPRSLLPPFAERNESSLRGTKGANPHSCVLFAFPVRAGESNDRGFMLARNCQGFLRKVLASSLIGERVPRSRGKERFASRLFALIRAILTELPIISRCRFID